MTFLKCKRCGHEWVQRVLHVKTCAKCRSPYWNVDRRKDLIKTKSDEKSGKTA